MRSIHTFLTKAAVPVVIAGAVICLGASSADAATAAAEHPCQPHANALSQVKQQIAAHNANGAIPRTPAQLAAQQPAYSAEASQLRVAQQRAISSLQLCLQQVRAAEAQAAAEAQQLAQAQARQQAAAQAQQLAQAQAQERASTPGLGGTRPFVAPPVPAEADAAKKAAESATKERNIELGQLRMYKTRYAADSMNDIERSELDFLIRKLELGEVSAAEAGQQRKALLDKARARRERYEPATVLDGAKKHNVLKATGERMDGIEVARRALSSQRAALADERKKLAESLKLDPENIDEAAIRNLRLGGKQVEADRLVKLDQQYKELGSQLVRKSEELGQVATRDFAEAKGARPLYEGPPGTPGTLDAVFYKPGRPITLFVCEAKGGGGQLGTRMIGGIAYQQGTPEYLRWMLDNDQGFRKTADKAGLLKLIETGEIATEYHLVHATGGVDVLVNQFNITPRP